MKNEEEKGMDIERALEAADRICDPDDGSVEELMEVGVDVVGALVAEVRRLGGSGCKSRGAAMIAAERVRQITDEDYTPEHDDEHVNGDIALAAVCYAAPEPIYVRRNEPEVVFRDPWPWGRNDDKRGPRFDRARRIRDLTKAGALIAAEIDRMLRRGGTP